MSVENDWQPPEAFLEAVRQHYGCVFERTGPAHLKNLLDKDTESKFFQKVRELTLSQKDTLFGITAPQPIEGFPETTVSIAPAKVLRGICDQNGDLTPLGQAIAKIYQVAEVLEVNVNILLISGSVQEIMGDKPEEKRHKEGGDNDLVIVVDNPKVVPELIGRLLNLSLPQDCDYQIELKEPCWRRGVTLIDIRDSQKNAIAQLSFPEAFYSHGVEVRFAMHAASRRNCPYILLVPNGKGLMGAIIDLDPDSKNYERVEFFQRGINVDYLRRTLKPTVYHWFELAFCMGNPPEAFYHLLHEMQTWAWGNLLPLADYFDRGWVNWAEVFSQYDEAKLKTVELLSKEFSEKIAERITHKIAKNPSLILELDNPKMVKKVHEEMTKTLVRSINGDPLLGLARFMAKGESPVEVPGFFPVYGLGFIDKKGFYPALYDFLHEGNRLQKLMQEMDVCEFGTKAGWKTFVKFLYQKTDGDLDALIKLLTPNFGPERLDSGLVETFISPYLKNGSPDSEMESNIVEEILALPEEPLPLYA